MSAAGPPAFRRPGLLCGLSGPALWALAIVVCGSLRPGFSHYRQYISELGERGSSTEILMRWGGFVPSGLMYIAFAGAMYALFRPIPLARIAALLVGINGLARIGAGLFACEPGCEAPMALAQRLHSASATAGFLAMIAAVILWSFPFRRLPETRGLAVYSLLSGLLGLLFLGLMVGSEATRAGTGLYERLASGVLSLWVFVVAARLLVLERARRSG